MRILLISDIHANLVALETVLAKAVPFDAIWCLGDVVGYGPEPNACIERLCSFDLLCLAGNHDWAALGKLDLEEFNTDARRAAIWTREQLTPANLEWLKDLPETVPTQADRFSLVHGSPRYPIWEYVLTPAVARTNFDFFDTPICFMGHTHVPVVYRIRSLDRATTADSLPENSPLKLNPDRMMINPGSVGQPRDGDPRAAYALLDLDAMTLTHSRVDYDIAATQEKMEQFGLPRRLITRLSYGW
ncbi:MAG: metallophosphoesterase family protein [Chloroflexota bacterium]|nr:metallophosphoesterase family protein [Chloroflexota bacterium]